MTTKKTFKQNATRAACGILASLTLVPNAMALTPSYTPSSSYRSGSYYTALQNVRLSGNQRSDIVAVAKSQLNYTEGNSSKQLSGTSNGSGNYTEYGSWYRLQDMWCAMFVSWCASQAGISSSIVPKHSFTVDGLNFFINKGQAYTRKQVANGVYTPQAGDIVYFKNARNSNKTNHVGIVTGYSNGTLSTIEGNTKSTGASGNGGGVYAKSYSISDTFIVYICSPSYSGNDLSSLIQGPSPLTDATNYNSAYFPKCSARETSLVNGLKQVGAQSSMSYRKQIAAANGISGYTGQSWQNLDLLSKLKAGTLRKPGGTSLDFDSLINNVDFNAITNSTTNNNSNNNSNNNTNTNTNSSTSSSSIYFPRCSAGETSLVNGLKQVGAQSSLSYRKQIAAANGIAGYTGKSWQNIDLLNKLKAGTLKKPGATSSSSGSSASVSNSNKYYPKCSSRETSFSDGLRSINVDNSYSFRKKIAVKNGFSNYRGTSSQNTQLLSMLKAGTLLRV